MSPKRKPTIGAIPATLLLALLALAFCTGTASARVTPLSATLEGGGLEEFSQTNVDRGTLGVSTTLAYEGGASAHATYDGDGGNGYARGIWNVSWRDGEDVWFGAAYYLPAGFLANVQGQVDLLRWDNWLSHPSDTDWGGVSIYGSDHRARLLRFGDGRPNDTLVGPLTLPEGRWFTLEVHERLLAGDGALSELYLDGKPVGRSTRPNTYGRPIERIRYGIVAIAEGDQHRPLALWFDRATAGPKPAPGSVDPAAFSARVSDHGGAAGGCSGRRRAGRPYRIWIGCGVQAERPKRRMGLQTHRSA